MVRLGAVLLLYLARPWIFPRRLVKMPVYADVYQKAK
jgi:hypothetical protein